MENATAGSEASRSTEGALRIFPESEAICMENATAGSEASRSTEGALRISPASAGSKNATAGGAASRSTEGALSPNPEDLSQRDYGLRKVPMATLTTFAPSPSLEALPKS